MVAILSILVAFSIGGFDQRPNVANIFVGAFFAWPFLLLIAKGINPAISWCSIWLSVPVMSWYLVLVSMQFSYPARGGGGGFGAYLGLIAGWSFMAIPFAVLSAIFIGVQFLIKKLRPLRPEIQSPEP